MTALRFWGWPSWISVISSSISLSSLPSLPSLYTRGKDLLSAPAIGLILIDFLARSIYPFKFKNRLMLWVFFLIKACTWKSLLMSAGDDCTTLGQCSSKSDRSHTKAFSCRSDLSLWNANKICWNSLPTYCGFRALTVCVRRGYSVYFIIQTSCSVSSDWRAYCNTVVKLFPVYLCDTDVIAESRLTWTSCGSNLKFCSVITASYTE